MLSKPFHNNSQNVPEIIYFRSILEENGKEVLVMLTFSQLGVLSTQMNILYVQGMNSGMKPDDPVELPKDSTLPLFVPALPDTPTLEEYSRTFLEFKKNTVQNSSYQYYERCFTGIQQFFGDMLLSAINGRKVQEYVNTMLRKGMNSKVAKYRVALLKSLLRCAESENLIHMPVIRPVYPKQGNEEYRILTEEEYRKLSDYLLCEHSPSSLALLIALYTGIRIGEMCGLRWDDFDTATNSISIRRAVKSYYIQRERRTVCEIGEPKTPKSRRRIYVSKAFADVLKERQGMGYIWTCSEKFINPRSEREYLNRRLKKLDIQHIKFHALRHGFATRAISAGIDPKTVAEILGHEHCDLTLDIYTSCTAQMQIEAMNKMEVKNDV